MKNLLFSGLLLAELSAQSLPVVSMQMDPDQIASSLREGRPSMPVADCEALDLWACSPKHPARPADISLRWMQLDVDPELEAVLVLEARAELANAAYVFDRHDAWNRVGSFFCQMGRCDLNTLIRVQKLTEDSPPLLLCYRDLGGSGVTILTTEAFQLRGGKLWPAFKVTNYEEVPWMPAYVTRRMVLASPDRLVVHTIREEPPGQVAQSQCEVLRWDAAKHGFVPVASERAVYCDPRTGKPVAGKSHSTGLPAHP